MSKLAKTAAISLLGYEIGEKVGSSGHESVVVKVEKADVVDADENEQAVWPIALIVVLLALLLLVIFAVAWRISNALKRMRRVEAIQMNERAPRI